MLFSVIVLTVIILFLLYIFLAYNKNYALTHKATGIVTNL
jgi:hypothetical protein